MQLPGVSVEVIEKRRVMCLQGSVVATHLIMIVTGTCPSVYVWELELRSLVPRPPQAFIACSMKSLGTRLGITCHQDVLTDVCIALCKGL